MCRYGSHVHDAEPAAIGRPRLARSRLQHGELAAFGINLTIGSAAIRRLPSVLAEHPLPVRLIAVLDRLHAHYKYLEEQIAKVEKELQLQLQEDALVQRLMAVPGVGPITASLLSAEPGDGKQYGCGQDFAVSLGLVPRQYSTEGRATLFGISKRGDKNLRRLLVQCARSYMQRLDKQKGMLADWVRAMLSRRHSNVVACASASELAPIVWALAARHTECRAAQASKAA